MSPLEHCRDLVRTRDYPNYVLSLFEPRSGRPKLLALLALEAELARVAFTVQSELLGHIRLQWWRDAIDELVNNQSPRKHPVVSLLAQELSAAELNACQQLIDAHGDDFQGQFDTVERLMTYAAHTGGNLFALCWGEDARGIGTVLSASRFYMNRERLVAHEWALPACTLEELLDSKTVRLDEVQAKPRKGLAMHRRAVRKLSADPQYRLEKDPLLAFALWFKE